MGQASTAGATDGPGPRAGSLRVVVTGASGNIGTSVVRSLADDPNVASILALARRRPDWTAPKTTWASVNVAEDPDLAAHFAGADAVIHLAWLFQPTRAPAMTWHNNVIGSERVFRAVAAAHVPALVHASSVAAYAPGPKDRAVDEGWPAHGWPESAYCQENAYVERLLDHFGHEHPEVRTVRLRPGIIVKPESASQQRRVFVGPFLPGALLHPRFLRVLPDVPGLRFQALHTEDAARAFHLAAVRPVAGAFNVAADPVVDAPMLARMFGSRVVRVPHRLARAAVDTAWQLRLLASPGGLFEAVLRFPLMDTTRARTELGWEPAHTSEEAITAFLTGLRHGAGMATPPLAADSPGGRLHEVVTGIGRRP
ncbi:NAD-dependent epimerase/dehydratase family protein [Streptomyces zagrosensis]|uniref:Nucleoside-diphosphate-sugar epimerase n=1 Tax=Streptomyces zagrosensis TaxID=1042984 RepID=A0A7W9UYX5_9ACTN|nr:NAD-dependent epimerase/dehydratase family protein [Streptomyces zagrosensis]MBB5936152.1 nucleoside-diphosphate-sugar epimerase [Streptomyces zagrosensis]